MKTIVRHFARYAWLAFVVSLPGTAHAASTSADSVHFCAFDEHQQLRRDRPRSAAKRPANLNVGEPRTVRMVYFLPNDRPFRQEVIDWLKSSIKQCQTFFGEQMQAYGYGNWTFRIETDTRGEPLVHRVDGQHPESRYFENTPGVVRRVWRREIEQVFDVEENIYVFYADISRQGGSPSGYRYSKKRGVVSFPAWNARWNVLAHELAHAFGLGHDFRDGSYILSYGGPSQIPGAGVWDRISACAAEFLSVHPYFNSEVPIEEYSPPDIRLLSPTEYPGGSKSVPIKFEVSDGEGLHQVLFYAAPGYGYGGLRECRALDGQRDAVIDFEYDGSSMFADLERAVTSLSDSVHLIDVRVVDVDGNVSRMKFDLISDRVVDVLRGHTDSVNAVAFSPDRTALASGSSDGTVRLWDVARRELLGILNGHAYPVMDVAFSRDQTLASASLNGIKLRDVTNREEIANLAGKAPLAFSQDGSLLASGSENHAVVVWNVMSLERTATLRGHSKQINALAFSPDRETLASGSSDGTVRLWNLAASEETAIFEHGGPIWSVAFSSAGDILASAVGSPENVVRLLHLRRRTKVELRPSGPFLSLTYSPGGEVLAAGAADGRVRLWNALTRELIGTLLPVQPFRPFDSGVRSVAISPDGTTLAAGLRDHTIILRDVSKWAGPRPSGLEIVPGDGWQGAPGAELAHPLVVEVRDQYGNSLTGVPVTFTVTSGGGTLSTTSDTTDTDGRASTILTLGSQPGLNTVVAAVAGLKPVTFKATAQAYADFDGDGTVGFGDFLQFAGKFGLSQGDEGYDARFDLDGNGAIGFGDFVIFAGAFGKSAS